jgi:hypothetical protein
MKLWREGAYRLERRMPREWQAAYEVAVEFGVNWLQRYATMDELLQTYFDLAYLDENDTDENGEDPFEVACRKAAEVTGRDYLLSSTLVEDVSYFRRARELIGGIPSSDSGLDQG